MSSVFPILTVSRIYLAEVGPALGRVNFGWVLPERPDGHVAARLPHRLHRLHRPHRRPGSLPHRRDRPLDVHPFGPIATLCLRGGGPFGRRSAAENGHSKNIPWQMGPPRAAAPLTLTRHELRRDLQM